MNPHNLNILAIGRNAEIMQVVYRLINAHEGWKATIVLTDEEAALLLGRDLYDIVMLCAGISKEEEEIWRKQLSQSAPATILIRHYGGGSGLLENEILALLH
jgi:hypothetical protein